MQGLLYQEDSFGIFLLVTVLLGGSGAWLSGRAIARTWRPWWTVVLYMLILGFAVRFVHFALFEGTLLSPYFYAVDTAILIAIALAGFRTTRQRQMARQYGALLGPSPRP
ncbi:DUF6867 family protein [Rhodoplanes roseus]|uniref:DUF6867 domain-containing protein n=1 Tax=Rhodoplanes roseus TaxID=29409 RepID=A0A327KWH2_9BRAD|nr:hypothetical protein [Rhodoplanes roseus]RAI42446.1 hypothetical protein CH341_19450 [Rhodoplanes roseus]